MSRMHYAVPRKALRSDGWSKLRPVCGASSYSRTTTNHKRVDCERCLRILVNRGQEAEGILRALEHERAKR